MSQEEMLLIIAIFILSVLGIIAIVELVISTYICKKSIAITLLKELNEEFSQIFINLQHNYIYTKMNKNKASFDRTNFDKILEEYYLGNESFFIDAINTIHHNKIEFKKYNDRCNYIFSNNKTDWNNIYIFQTKEEKLFNKYKLQPCIDIIITIYSKYISPKGKNSYSKRHLFNYLDLELMIENLKKQNQFQKSKQYQRMIMTDSLRYDVMKRDNFKCVLCGATAKEGAKLHVDHIIPVSKGGQTQLSNLRTLCDQCNLGKRDKFDYYGLN